MTADEQTDLHRIATAVEVIQSRIEDILKDHSDVQRTLSGNGRPGVVRTVDNHEIRLTGLEAARATTGLRVWDVVSSMGVMIGGVGIALLGLAALLFLTHTMGWR